MKTSFNDSNLSLCKLPTSTVVASHLRPEPVGKTCHQNVNQKSFLLGWNMQIEKVWHCSVWNIDIGGWRGAINKVPCRHQNLFERKREYNTDHGLACYAAALASVSDQTSPSCLPTFLSLCASQATGPESPPTGLLQIPPISDAKYTVRHPSQLLTNRLSYTHHIIFKEHILILTNPSITVPTEIIHTPWLFPPDVIAWIQNGWNIFFSPSTDNTP